MTEFPQINVQYQTTDPGSSENTKKDNCKKLQRLITFKLQTTKDKKILKFRRNKNQTKILHL